MHYYQFNIGDYASHTGHLDEIEDLAYRRMLDYCYLNEIGLPESPEEVGRLIRMRTHSECIANVLREFFTLDDDGVWRNNRVETELQAFREKSGKAKKAARKRWENAHADALQAHSERNAKHKPITNNQKPITNDDAGASKTRTSKLDFSCWPAMPSEQVLTDWLDMRKRLKANVSQTVVNQFSKELWLATQGGYTVDDCLGECITSNWRGFKFSWLKNREAPNGTNQFAARPTRSEQNERAHREYVAELERQIEREEAEAAGGYVAGVIEPPPSDRSH